MIDPQAAGDEPDDPADDAASRTRPLWMAFLLPVAIVIAGAMVSLTLILTRGGDDPAPATDSGGVSRLPGVAGTPATLLATFTGYAKEAGADSTAFQACINTGSARLEASLSRQLQEGIRLGVNGTPTFFINNKMVIGAQPYAVFEELIDAELGGSPANFDGYSATVKQLAATGRAAISVDRPNLADATFEGGGAKAKVVIVEFSDFQCPFCKKWTDETLPRIRQRLGPDVSLAFIHFPIVQIHPNAGNASAAALCAAEQGKFWPMHDLLFKRQQDWEQLR